MHRDNLRSLSYHLHVKILIVEDDEDIRTLIRYHLSAAGFEIDEAADGEKAVEKLDGSLSLVVLDLMLPRLSGLEVLSAIRKDHPSLPVIVTSALTEENDILTALERGADDYVTKPFSPKILVARVRSVLRRTERNDGEQVATDGGIILDKGRRECFVSGTPVSLTATEFDILRSLIEADGRVMRRTELIEKIKGDDYPVTERSVDVQIASLRKKLGSMGKGIITVWGIGYRYAEE